MPLIKIETSVECEYDQKIKLAKLLTSLVASCMGKNESSVATVIETDALVTFGGEVVDGAFVDVKGIGGFNEDINLTLTQAICSALKETLGIEHNHTYINFTDVDGVNWGFNNRIFG